MERPWLATHFAPAEKVVKSMLVAFTYNHTRKLCGSKADASSAPHSRAVPVSKCTSIRHCSHVQEHQCPQVRETLRTAETQAKTTDGQFARSHCHRRDCCFADIAAAAVSRLLLPHLAHWTMSSCCKCCKPSESRHKRTLHLQPTLNPKGFVTFLSISTSA